MSMNKKKKLVIFGTGEIGELAKFYFHHDSEYEVVGFTADDEFCQAGSFQDLPLVPLSQVTAKFPPAQFAMHVALSYKKLNQIRAEKYFAAKALGYTLASYVCSKSVTWPDLTMGDNCFILENQTIQPTVKIGNNVMIWSGNHLGHASVIGDHTYISSHVCISGHTQIGSYGFWGVNSASKDFIKVGDSVFVTMGTAVTRDIPDGSVVTPQETFAESHRMARHLKQKYFHLNGQELIAPTQ